MNTDDDRIRALLDEAVSGVEPRGSLDELRSRTGTSRSHRRWVWVAGGAVVATAAAIAAVAVLPSDPGTTGAGPGPAAAGRSNHGTVTAYYVGGTPRGPRLFPETYPVRPDEQESRVVQRSVAGDADDPDYSSLWPTGVVVRDVRLTHDALTVDLDGEVLHRPAGLSEAGAALAVQQLVWSAQSATGSTLPVTFLVDGGPPETVLGVPSGQPVPRSSDESLAQVQVATPSDGATLDSPFTVTGRAAAFEANVQWELMRGDTVVKRGFTTAEECCTLSPYSFEVTAAPGAYTLVVHDEDASGGAEGTGHVEDTKRVTVR